MSEDCKGCRHRNVFGGCEIDELPCMRIGTSKPRAQIIIEPRHRPSPVAPVPDPAVVHRREVDRRRKEAIQKIKRELAAATSRTAPTPKKVGKRQASKPSKSARPKVRAADLDGAIVLFTATGDGTGILREPRGWGARSLASVPDRCLAEYDYRGRFRFAEGRQEIDEACPVELVGMQRTPASGWFRAKVRAGEKCEICDSGDFRGFSFFPLEIEGQSLWLTIHGCFKSPLERAH